MARLDDATPPGRRCQPRHGSIALPTPIVAGRTDLQHVHVADVVTYGPWFGTIRFIMTDECGSLWWRPLPMQEAGALVIRRGDSRIRRNALGKGPVHAHQPAQHRAARQRQPPHHAPPLHHAPPSRIGQPIDQCTHTSLLPRNRVKAAKTLHPVRAHLSISRRVDTSLSLFARRNQYPR